MVEVHLVSAEPWAKPMYRHLPSLPLLEVTEILTSASSWTLFPLSCQKSPLIPLAILRKQMSMHWVERKPIIRKPGATSLSARTSAAACCSVYRSLLVVQANASQLHHSAESRSSPFVNRIFIKTTSSGTETICSSPYCYSAKRRFTSLLLR